MRYPPRTLRNLLLSGAVFLACIELGACGYTCFAGIFPNGNGVIFTRTSNTPPACPPSTSTAMMNVAVTKSEPCAACTSAIRAEHIFVTLKTIQLHSMSTSSSNTPEWIDLAPQLLLQPRPIDVVGDSSPLILVQNALIPVGTYREVRLQFAPDTSASSGEALPAEISCGENRGNCMLMANGNIERLYFAAEPPQLLVPLQINGSNSLAVVPGTTLDLRLTLQPQQASSVSTSEGWHLHYVLVGSASISREDSVVH
jgi:hypothetical protein